jgi:S-phase kinase-associated protein 1
MDFVPLTPNVFLTT